MQKSKSSKVEKKVETSAAFFSIARLSIVVIIKKTISINILIIQFIEFLIKIVKNLIDSEYYNNVATRVINNCIALTEIIGKWQ